MTMTGALAVAATLAMAAMPCAARMAPSAAKGMELFEDRCVFCHAPAGGGQGPSLTGVFGRKAGSLGGFAYSPALRASALVWSRSTLDAFLLSPGKAVPGTAMQLSLPDSGQGGEVIAYLASLRAAR